MSTEDASERERIEAAILSSWVSDELSLLDPYHGTLDSNPYYFRWAESDEGAIVFFKPRMISMKVLMSWLSVTGVMDIQLHRQSMFAANMLGVKADLQEVAILLTKA